MLQKKSLFIFFDLLKHFSIYAYRRRLKSTYSTNHLLINRFIETQGRDSVRLSRGNRLNSRRGRSLKRVDVSFFSKRYNMKCIKRYF